MPPEELAKLQAEGYGGLIAEHVELYAAVTISVSVKDNADVTIEDDDAISAAFGAAEQVIRDRLSRERFAVDSDA